ncbi:hypothetical protein [Nostoc sp.]|uniref:hypothetical protein n=1 Tax=Nostoc sp. TaxID=1180 RepID=UPI002FFA251B
MSALIVQVKCATAKGLTRNKYIHLVGWASCHWCKLNVKTCLEAAFRLSHSQSETGNDVLAPPPLLAAEPQRAAFPASGWKRGFKGVLTLS